MKQVRHTFDSSIAANAFADGVEYANDGDLFVVGVEVGRDHLGPKATVIINDENGAESEQYEVDHRNLRPTPPTRISG